MLASNIIEHVHASRDTRDVVSGVETAMNQDERNQVAGAGGVGDKHAPAREPDAGDVEQQERASPEGARAAESQPDSESGRSESEELSRMREAMLRLQAEMDNREKRLEREMAKSRKFALEAVMRDLVQVLDSMDQALSSADAENAQAAYEGLELTRKQALQVLNSHGLEVVDPVGERFDPSWHEAIATQPSDEFEPDTVAQVLQKGYMLNDRLIRPARVIVAK